MLIKFPAADDPSSSPKPISSESDVSLAPPSSMPCEVLHLIDRLQVLVLRDPVAGAVTIGMIEGFLDEALK